MTPGHEEVAAGTSDHPWAADGLPIVLPTGDAVRAFVASSGEPPDGVLGLLPPKWAPLTVEKLAANAVMAGCRADYVPLLLAAFKAMLDAAFNLYVVQTTTHPVTPFLLVGGPVADRLGIHGGAGAFGPGFRSNATIGRAVRLTLMNVGGCLPGDLDRSTQGHGGKWGACVSENLEQVAWPAFHVEQGHAEGESLVTVVGLDGLRNINDHVNGHPEGLMVTVADAMSTMAINTAYLPGPVGLFLSPEHAEILADAGWSRGDVRGYLYENARIDTRTARLGGMYDMHEWPRRFAASADSRVPVFQSVQDLLVFVVGGIGRHSTFAASVGRSWPVTRPVPDASADAGSSPPQETP